MNHRDYDLTKLSLSVVAFPLGNPITVRFLLDHYTASIPSSIIKYN